MEFTPPRDRGAAAVLLWGSALPLHAGEMKGMDVRQARRGCAVCGRNLFLLRIAMKDNILERHSPYGVSIGCGSVNTVGTAGHGRVGIIRTVPRREQTQISTSICRK